MLASLGLVAFAAIAAVFTTTGVVISQKREAKQSAKAFETYKLEAAATVAASDARSAEASAKAEGFRLHIASANESAEQARAQVAGATAEAARANLELERIKMPRSFMDVPALISELSTLKGTEYTFSGVAPDEESIMLLRAVDEMLQSAGWKRAAPIGGFPAIKIYGTDDVAVPHALLDGIRIAVEHPDAPFDNNRPIETFPDIVKRAVFLNVALFNKLTPPEASGSPRIVHLSKGESTSIRISVGRKVMAPGSSKMGVPMEQPFKPAHP